MYCRPCSGNPNTGVQQTAFPNVMYGDAGNMVAGYGINLLSDAIKGRIKSSLNIWNCSLPISTNWY